MDKYAFQFIKQFTDSYELRYVNRAMYENTEMSQDHARRVFLRMAYHGDAEYCSRFPSTIIREYDQIVPSISHHGNIAMCRLICKIVPIVTWKVAQCAGAGNHRHICEWLINEYPTDRGSLSTFFAAGAAANGHMELCKYGLSMIVNIRDINHVLTSAAQGGQYEICEMIIANIGDYDYIAAALSAADNGQIATCAMFCKYLNTRVLRQLRNIGANRKHDSIVSLADEWIAKVAA